MTTKTSRTDWYGKFLVLILPEIIYNELNMLYLSGSKAGYIQHLRAAYLPPFPAQQIIGADVKVIRNTGDISFLLEILPFLAKFQFAFGSISAHIRYPSPG